MQICISVRFQICHRLTELFPKPRDNDALRPGSVTLAAERLGRSKPQQSARSRRSPRSTYSPLPPCAPSR